MARAAAVAAGAAKALVWFSDLKFASELAEMMQRTSNPPRWRDEAQFALIVEAMA
jgi:hypothetical protein